MTLARLDLIAADALDLLWRASWQAAVLAGMVLLVQWLLRDRLSPRWRYNLWMLVLLRLIIPVTPQSSLSVFNLSNRFAPARTTVATAEYPVNPPGAPTARHASPPLAVSHVSHPEGAVDGPWWSIERAIDDPRGGAKAPPSTR